MQADDDNEPGAQYSSPPCFMHELQPGFAMAEPGDPVASADVSRWRKAERERLIAARLALSADTRAGHAARIAERLDAEIGRIDGRTVGIYWPFRGEPDLRGWASTVTERGGALALPVVVAKGAPLVFRSWKQGDRLEKGVWNIPVPADGEEVFPDVVVSPVVGFDGQSYRLGYGGGFFAPVYSAALRREPRSRPCSSSTG